MEDQVAFEEDVDIGIGLFDPKDMPKRIRHTVVDLDVALATHYLNINKYARQRPFMERRKQELLRKCHDGRYHGGEIAVARLQFNYEVPGDDGAPPITMRELLVNGQHTAWLVKETGITQSVTLKEFDVANMLQLLSLWGQFDAPGGQRSAGQIAASYQDVMPAWPQTALTNCAQAVVYAAYKAHGGRDYKKMTIDEKIKLLVSPKYTEAGEFVRDLIYINSPRYLQQHMSRQGVLAAMMVTYQSNPDLAATFWDKVRSALNLQPDTAENTLYRYLTTTVVGNSNGRGRGRTGGGQKRPVTTDDVFARCLQAFEAAQKGKSLTSFGPIGKKRSKKLVASKN